MPTSVKNKEGFKYFVEGERIFLREAVVSDANENYVRWMNDEEVTQFLESRFQTHTIESIKNYIEAAQAQPGQILFAICLKENNQHIGNIKLGPEAPGEITYFGIMIGEKSQWGKGLATEAIRLVSEFAFKKFKLKKLGARCYATNTGSKKAFEKAGYTQEKYLKNFRANKGKYADSLLFTCDRNSYMGDNSA